MAHSGVPQNTSESEELKEAARGAMRTNPTFEEIYAQFGERVLNLAYRFTHDEESARDMTQEVFTKVYEHMGSFREESGMYTWIHRIAVNHILNHLKKERRHRWLSLLDERVADLLSDERVVEPSFHHRVSPPSPHRILEENERDELVRSAVASLPIKYRVPFELYRFEEMSYLQIAETMNLSLSAVEARIHRAKKQLLVKLEPWLDSI